jgi:two-component system chemotaxis response regulator CheB
MSRVDVVVIGASAGGLQAMLDILAGLPDTLPVAIVTAVHTRSEGNSFLPMVLQRGTPLKVSFAENGQQIEPGRIYVAPPDHHVLITPAGVALSRGPRENGFRPAVDPLFRSAARVFGARVMGVILSGALDDGSYGLKAIKQRGGLAVVQDPEEASFPGMPLSALRFVEVDHVAPAQRIAELIIEAANGASSGRENMPSRKALDAHEPDPQDPVDETEVREMQEMFGPPSALTCPDCGGALWELKNGALARYRCHVGHQYTTEGLDAGQRDAVEGALWSAVRVLEEQADLRRRMARRAEASGLDVVSAGFQKSAHDSHLQAHTIRQMLLGTPPPPESEPIASSAAAAVIRSPRAK